jgi:hypothetical protein
MAKVDVDEGRRLDGSWEVDVAKTREEKTIQGLNESP